MLKSASCLGEGGFSLIGDGRYFVHVSRSESEEERNRCEYAQIEHWIYDMTLVAPYASDQIGFPTGRGESFSNKTMHQNTLRRNEFTDKSFPAVLTCTLLW
jgi:hypothetical protein